MKFDLSYKVSPNQDRVFARGIEANNFEDAQSKLIEYWLGKNGTLVIAVCIDRIY